jgi:serine protease Do
MSTTKHAPSVSPNQATFAPARRRTPRGLAAIAGVSMLALLATAPHFAGQAQKAPESAGIQSLVPPGAPMSFADLVDRVKPAVVSISVTSGNPRTARNQPQAPGKRPPSRGGPQDMIPEGPEGDALRRFFDQLPREFGGGGGGSGPQRPALSQGSGFVISEDGYVVTNNHVIDGATKITVAFDENNKHEAKLIGTDQRTDLALLKITTPGKTFKAVKFATNQGRVGDWVLAVGNPFGLGGTVTAGIISALGRDIGSGPYDFLQIDAAVNRGNSGGPTFNLEGDVVGVNTAIYSPGSSGGNVGIAFAVPSKVATEVIEQLKSGGSVSRGWLGVKIQDVDEDIAQSLGVKDIKGALINEVTVGGPAAASGLRTQDLIMSVDSTTITNSRELARKIAEYAPDSSVNVKVLRANKEETIKVKLGKFPGATDEVAKVEPKKPVAPAELGSLGLAFGAVTGGSKEGVQITDVDNNSDAASRGLKNGDVVIEINNQPVTSATDIDAAVKKAQDAGRPSVLLTVKSGDQRRVVPVKMVTKKG